MVVNQLLSHQTLSRDAFLFALKDSRLSAIHLLGRWRALLFVSESIKTKCLFPPQKPEPMFGRVRSQAGGGGEGKSPCCLVNQSQTREGVGYNRTPSPGRGSAPQGQFQSHLGRPL